MKLRANVLAISLSVVGLSVAITREARACGGCLVQQSESTQVTSHRMILSISPAATTLWDQITYAGAPESFAWVLPVSGRADVELSSDALFEALEQMTAVQVFSPQINCNPGACGPTSAGGDGFGGSGAGGGGVTVVAQETVGPYETVQLSSQNPNALRDWLVMNGYNVPSDIAPVIAAYVAEGFDFLALKLVPGEGVSSMRPVRVTTAGASPKLPLRMVAAGTGAVTPITLWIMGEGRYEPVNFPSFVITAPEIVWNWDTQSSNYAELRRATFERSGGTAWLAEAAEPMSSFALRDALTSLAELSPEESGYADENGEGAVEQAGADLDALFSGIPEGSLWISRIYGELSRGGLATDLEVGASMEQTVVERFLQVEKSIGTAPSCPPPPDCGDGVGSSGSSSSGPKPGSCALDGRADGPTALAGAAALAALALWRRRPARARRRADRAR